MTPQCLVEAIKAKEVKMTDFSMIVLDECHHVGQGEHACKVLMGLYMDVKYSEGAQLGALPQVPTTTVTTLTVSQCFCFVFCFWCVCVHVRVCA